MKASENGIEWIKNEKVAAVTLTQKRMMSQIKKYAHVRPEECQIVAENTDGSVIAKIPVSWVKVSPPKQYSDKQKKIMGDRLNADGLKLR